MSTIENSVTIERPPAEVWAVLGDLPAVAEWVPGIASARMEGTTRICILAEGNGEIREEISDYSDGRRSFSYTQPVHPLGLRRSQGTFVVEPDGSGSRVVWTAEVEFAEPAHESQFLGLLEQGYRAAIESLKSKVES